MWTGLWCSECRLPPSGCRWRWCAASSTAPPIAPSAWACSTSCLRSALFRRTGSGMRLLVECFIALSLAFGTLAIPLAFDGRMTSAAWALEGAAVAWVAVRQGRLLARSFGYLLQFAAGIAFLLDAERGGYGSHPGAEQRLCRHRIHRGGGILLRCLYRTQPRQAPCGGVHALAMCFWAGAPCGGSAAARWRSRAT